MEVLVVGEQSMALSTKHIIVPHPQQTEDHRNLETHTHTHTYTHTHTHTHRGGYNIGYR